MAPLSVFFDATGTTSTKTARPFHDIEYRWNFGESAGVGASAWDQGSRPGISSRNLATGPVAAHVFETPGTYTIAVSDAGKTVAYECQISVADPNVVFAGAKTACFSTSGTFSGCPPGASQIKTSDFAVVTNTATLGNNVRRLLLRRGEVWTATATSEIVVPGPGIVGSFGAGDRPVVQASFDASAPIISFSNDTTPTMKDWRLMDVAIDGAGTVGTKAWGVGAGGGIDQLTILRVNANALHLGVLMSDQLLDVWNSDANPRRHGHHVWDQLSIVDMDITNMPAGIASDTGTWNYGTYLAGERVFYAGNSMDGRGTATEGVSHNARFTYLGKAVISNNTLQRPGPTEHAIKLHAAAWGNTGVSGTGGIGNGYTRWVVISDNKIVGAYGAGPVALGPQGSDVDERGRDIILERNLHIAGPGTQWAQVIWFSDVTSRNNIFDMTGSRYAGGVMVAQRAPFQVPPDRVGVYNNTMYSPGVTNSFIGVQLDPSVTNAVVRNNLAYAPRDPRPVMIDGNGNSTAPVVLQNNTTNPQTDPQFTGPLSAPPGFAVKRGSYAKRAGPFAKVFSDFFEFDRPNGGATDIGAISD